MSGLPWPWMLSLIATIVSATATVFIAIGMARIAKALESMNITTMDAAETVKRIEKMRR